MRVGILGYGEIGQAVAKFYPVFSFKDLRERYGWDNLDVMHVCLPWSEKFIETVGNEITTVGSQLVIIHSTTKPGTTMQLAKAFDHRDIVHSPVRGMHPNLHPGMKTFVKYIGADKEESGKKACCHLKLWGIKTKVVNSSISTELAKILSTSYYGVCIAWHQEMYEISQRYGVDFDVIKDFNLTYNEGYKKMGKDNVVRPTLDPPMGPIGGHCVVPNAEMLGKDVMSCFLKLITGCGK